MNTINAYLTQRKADIRWVLNELFQAHIRGPLRSLARRILADELDRYATALARKTERARTLQAERDAMRASFQVALEMGDWARSDKCPPEARGAVLSWAGLLNWSKAKNSVCRDKSQFGIVDDFARWGLTR